MPITVQLAEDAWIDLEELVDFLLAQDDPTAPELLAFVLDGLQVLTHQPGIGRPMEDGLRELIEEGLNSGPGQALTPQRAAQLKKQALGKRR